MNIGYFFNDDNANIDWLRAALFKSARAHVHTSAARVNDLTRPRMYKKAKGEENETSASNHQSQQRREDHIRHEKWRLPVTRSKCNNPSIHLRVFFSSDALFQSINHLSFSFVLLVVVRMRATLIFHSTRIDEQEELLSSARYYADD